MTRDPLASFSQETQYRRGTIMGLTIAEAFMLVAFVLLMLLVFWFFRMEDNHKRMEAKYNEARKFAEGLSPREKAAVEDASIREALVILYELRGTGVDVVETMEALRSGAVLVQRGRLVELETRVRLLDESEIRQIAEAVAVLPPERKRMLSRLVSVSEFGPLLEKVAILQEALRGRSAAEIQTALALHDAINPDGEADIELLKKRHVELRRLAGVVERAESGDVEEKVAALREVIRGRSAAEVKAALALRETLDRDGEYSNRQLLEMIQSPGARVRSRIAKQERARERLVADLKTSLGSQIAQVGGRIEKTGKIVVPDKVLFLTGQDGIRPQVAQFLKDFCPRWLAALKNSGAKKDVAEIRIEGHSSSEWNSVDTPRKAWLLNLALSQRRAQAVLERCLALVAQSDLGAWARGKLTAVGYSSSRPVFVNGSEDVRRSRRVVFGTEFSRERLLKEIGDDVGKELRDARKLEGAARVKDADTIEIGGQSVRLDGIDGLERNQTCRRPDGSAWRCGMEAVRALEGHIRGREVVCENLRVDLRRYRGRCRVGDEDLNRWLVRAGWAFAHVKYSRDYAFDEKASRLAQSGAWAGKVDPPWEWRRKRLDGAAAGP